MTKTYHLAVIDEAKCIGCTKCIDVCPVDAIVGATGHMHTVLNDLCIGCDLCLPPCPVQCISLTPSLMTQDERQTQAKKAKQQHSNRKARLERLDEQKRAADLIALSNADDIIAATLARAKAKKHGLLTPHE
jgi:electron transport complex protein RnfB